MIRAALNGLSALAGRAVAAYREYVRKANDKARAQALYIKAVRYYNAWIGTFKFLLCEAIRATAAVNGLVVPVDPDRLMVSNPMRVNAFGIPFLAYGSWDRPGYNVPVKEIQAQLNTEFDRICTYNGLPQIRVAKVCRCENRRVLFAVALAADIRASKQAAQKAAQNAAKTAQGVKK